MTQRSTRMGTATRLGVLAFGVAVTSAALQRHEGFPESMFARPRAATTAMVKGRPVPLSPAYEDLAVGSVLRDGERIYMIAHNVLSDGSSLVHLIAIGGRPGDERAVATTRLSGQRIEDASVLRTDAGGLVIAGPTRSFRLREMQWVPSRPDSLRPKPPIEVPDATDANTFRDARGQWWAVAHPLDAEAAAMRAGGTDVEGTTTQVGFNALGATPKFYLPPKPDMATYKRFRAKEVALNGTPDRIEAAVGAAARVGDLVWFGLTFYDSEGTSGVGAIGAFDLAKRTFDMRWGAGDPECSISEMEVHGDDIWVALGVSAEYGTYRCGAAHYSIATKQSTPLDVPGTIHAIAHWNRSSGTIFATSDGLFRAIGKDVIPLPIEWER